MGSQRLEGSPPPYFQKAYFKTNSSNTIERGAMLEAWVEIFKLNPQFHCPNCDSVFYNSQNYMEAPPWLSVPIREEAITSDYKVRGVKPEGGY